MRMKPYKAVVKAGDETEIVYYWSQYASINNRNLIDAANRYMDMNPDKKIGNIQVINNKHLPYSQIDLLRKQDKIVEERQMIAKTKVVLDEIASRATEDKDGTEE